MYAEISPALMVPCERHALQHSSAAGLLQSHQSRQGASQAAAARTRSLLSSNTAQVKLLTWDGLAVAIVNIWHAEVTMQG